MNTHETSRESGLIRSGNGALTDIAMNKMRKMPFSSPFSVHL
jgi:hypothetical protein